MSADSPTTMRHETPEFSIEKGANVFIHQAFACCPYAGLITSKIHDFVELNGYTVVDEPENAAVQVINTCGYNDTRSQLAYDAIQTVRDRNPEAAVVVTGCLTRIEHHKVKDSLQGVSRHAMLGPKHLEDLDLIFDHTLTSFESTPTAFHKDRYSSADPRDGLFQITVSTGCLGRCSFCAIRRATGRPKSMTLDEILAEVRRGLAEGHRDFFLASTDLSTWGHDHGQTVVDLLRALVELPEDFFIHGEAFEPTNFFSHIDEIEPLFHSGKFAWLVFPVQSGSQRILDGMRRTYSIDEVMRGIERLKTADPTLVTCTDIIYGFGDESWEEFLRSVEVGRKFDYAKYNNYEPRPGTPPLVLSAADMVRRREFVMEELGRQGLEVDILTRKRKSPYLGKRDRHVSDELGAWLDEYERRFRKLIARKGGIQLAGGYVIDHAAADKIELRSLVLSARRTDGAGLRFGLVPAGTAAPFLASSPRFQLSVLRDDEGAELTSDETYATSALSAMLDLTASQPGAAAEAGPGTEVAELGLRASGKDLWSSAPDRERVRLRVT
ncbi:MAG: radical SAM protein [Myxococcales bacterium]|nr:radical SAM protein [Myxococcales bacterium]